jgi:hypothetical protein
VMTWLACGCDADGGVEPAEDHARADAHRS